MLGDSGDAEADGAQEMLSGPVPSSLHRHQPHHNYDSLGLSQLVIAYSDK